MDDVGRIAVRRVRLTLIFGIAVVAALGAALGVAQSVRERDAQLQAVRKEIKALEARVASQTAQRDESARTLRAAELDAAAEARKLADLRARLAAQQTARRALVERTTRATRRLATERATLASQVRTSYMNGRAELPKLVLSQQSPASLGRMLVYFDYFNRERSARIGAVSAEVADLSDLRQQSEKAAAELASLESAESAQVASLEHARDERRALVAKLDAGIADSNEKIGKARADEKRLADLVAELTQLMAGFPVDREQPFDRLKGKLAWPVMGRLAGEFGQPREGGTVRWNGVLIEANQGTPVRAIYRGRVAFADWLPGLGLLLVLDHGGGYMSLYGHNQSLLKEPGDWVSPGETIAQVGDTGGQARPALYFEIRAKGEPVNPHDWIKKPIGR
jgi:septal ring factor EnvC (AmiA/AmiB activator)